MAPLLVQPLRSRPARPQHQPVGPAHTSAAPSSSPASPASADVPPARRATTRSTLGSPGRRPASPRCAATHAIPSMRPAPGDVRPPHAQALRPPQRDLLPLRKGEIPPRERPRRPRQVRRRRPTRLAKPSRPDWLRYPHLHRDILARQTLGKECPEPPPVRLTRHWRPPRRPQLHPQTPIRTPPTRHRNSPPLQCCEDHLSPPWLP